MRSPDTIVGALTACIPIFYVAFAVLRRHQLSLPDPYNNPYTTWSTAFLGAFVASCLANLVVLSALSRRLDRRTKLVAWTVVGIGCIHIAWMLVGMTRFVHPEWFS